MAGCCYGMNIGENHQALYVAEFSEERWGEASFCLWQSIDACVWRGQPHATNIVVACCFPAREITTFCLSGSVMSTQYTGTVGAVDGWRARAIGTTSCITTQCRSKQEGASTNEQNLCVDKHSGWGGTSNKLYACSVPHASRLN